jgi:hypothetical protein
MPARKTAKAAISIPKKWPAPSRKVSVQDQHTERTAGASASDMIVLETENDFRNRDVQVTIRASYGDSPDSSTYVECTATDAFTRRGPNNIVRRKTTIEQLHLGDLPLLVLALEEAIRIGVEQGTFPEIRGGAKS